MIATEWYRYHNITQISCDLDDCDYAICHVYGSETIFYNLTECLQWNRDNATYDTRFYYINNYCDIYYYNNQSASSECTENGTKILRKLYHGLDCNDDNLYNIIEYSGGANDCDYLENSEFFGRSQYKPVDIYCSISDSNYTEIPTTMQPADQQTTMTPTERSTNQSITSDPTMSTADEITFFTSQLKNITLDINMLETTNDQSDAISSFFCNSSYLKYVFAMFFACCLHP